MLHQRELVGWSILTLIIVWPLALWGGGDSEIQEPKTPIARLEVQSARVDWLPQVNYESLILTVVGPGNLYIQREFSPGETPFFSSFDADGGNLPDGSYAYELRVVPRPTPQTGDEPLIKSLVQSGHLLIQGGSFVDRLPLPPSPNSGSTHAPSSVTPKVVQGRTCIGAGCGPGDDNVPALKLKELFDTRLTFENSGCCHPSTQNWALQANDVANSTGDFMIRDLTNNTIPFRIVSTGPGSDNAFTIFYNGNIGLGTSTPGARLHMFGSATADVFGSAGPDPASGPAFNFGYGGTSFGRGAGFLNARPDASATAPNPSLRFLTANIERMIITNTGNVGIGTSSVPKRLTIKSAGGNDDVIQVIKSSGSTPIFRLFETTSGDGLFSVFDNTGSEAARFTSVSGGKFALGCNAPEHRLDLGNVPGAACSTATARSYIDAGSTIWTASSSRSIKENLAPVQVPEILDKISAVGVYSYDFIEGPKDKIGLMAEDFHTVFGRGSDKLLNGQEVEMALWLAVQELTAQNKQLTDQNRDLAAQNQDFGRRLASLEARLAAEPAP